MLNTDTIQITPELLALIAEIAEFKGAWRALGTLAPERLSALRRVATIESIGSSTRIEGSKLSNRDVERLLGNLEIKSFATRDEQEVAGYAEVMDTIFHAWPDIKITENHIRQFHRDLLTYSHKASSEVNSLRIPDAVCVARSITSRIEATHCHDNGWLVVLRSSIMRFQCSTKPSPLVPPDIPCLSTSPKVRVALGVSNKYSTMPNPYS